MKTRPKKRPEADAQPASGTLVVPGTLDIQPFLESLISAAGLSGHEGPVLHLIRDKWQPMLDEVSTSRLGSLHGLKRGNARGRRPAIMLAAHMDSIGLIVTGVEQDVLHFHEIGGVDPRILPGTPVIVHGKRPLPGVVAIPPLRTLPASEEEGALGLRRLVVDVGLPPRQLAQAVRVGDLISFDTKPVVLAGDTLSGHSLDDRASVAALTLCLMELKSRAHEWDVWAVATSQEEETYGGAATSAFELNPDLAVVIDVTHGKGPGLGGWQTVPFGKGPTIAGGANLHPFLKRRFKELAEKLNIPAVPELAPTSSGTDAEAVQLAREGIPTALLEIPLRYMHTAVEVISMKDVQRTGRLLAEFISQLSLDFMTTITWEEADAD